jgi:GNAT superfamily N-acetyltransferase
MIFREANNRDIVAMHKVRVAVMENKLSDAFRINYADYSEHITKRGKGWVCELRKTIVGFGITDLISNNIWALFVEPAYENKGIGKKLQRMMLEWYFLHTRQPVSLTTKAGTRAELFYRKSGWKESGYNSNGEMLFTMSYENWKIFEM